MAASSLYQVFRVEAMGLEPTNLLTASQALYQLSYAPVGVHLTICPGQRGARSPPTWEVSRSEGASKFCNRSSSRALSKDDSGHLVSSGLVHLTADVAVDVAGDRHRAVTEAFLHTFSPTPASRAALA